MLQFDKEKEVLLAGNFIRKEDLTPIVSPVYQDFKKYLDSGGLKDTINTILSGLWSEMKEYSVGRTVLEEVIVKEVEGSHYQVDVILFNAHLGSESQVTPFTFMNLPIIREDGCIKNLNREYGFIHYLENKSGLYFSTDEDNDRDNTKKNLKLVMDAGPIISFMYTSNSSETAVRMKIGGTKLNSLFTGLAFEEDIDVRKEIMKDFRDMRYTKIKPEKIVNRDAIYLEDNVEGYKEALERLTTNEKYIISPETRKKLNEALSFKRAIGEVLSDDVLYDNGSTVLYRKGTLVTEEVVEDLNRHMVSRIFVSDVPNITGMVLRETLKLYEFRKGSKIIDEIRDYFPEYDDLMYLPRDVYWSEENRLDMMGIFFLVEGMHKMNKDLVEFLEYNMVTSIVVGNSVTTESLTKIYLSREIFSNCQVKCSTIGVNETESGYVPYNYKGKIIEDTGRITCMDIVAITSLLLSLSKGRDFNIVTDLDISYSKKYATYPEKLEKAMIEAWTSKFMPMIKQKAISGLADNTAKLNDSRWMSDLFQGFTGQVWSRLLAVDRCLNLVDTMNPLSYLSSLRQVKTFVADPNAVSASRRYMSMYQLGRACPYETPSSNKVGLTNYMAIGSKIQDGEPMARFYKVVSNGNSVKIDTSREIYLTVDEEEGYITTTIDSIGLDITTLEEGLSDRYANKLVMARIPNPNMDTMEKCSIGKVRVRDLDYVTVRPDDHLSLVVGTLPLVGSNDAVRVSFDASMMKQARGLITQEAPLVYTDVSEELFRYTDKYCRYAKHSGTVVAVDITDITILYDNGEEECIDLEPLEICPQTIIERYFVKNFREGDRLHKNQLIISTNFDDKGVLAIGKNVLVGYVPMGKNYEDGVLSSSRIRQSLVSYRVNKQKGKFPYNLGKPVNMSPRNFDYITKNSKVGTVLFGRGNKTKRTENANIELGFCLEFTNDTTESKLKKRVRKSFGYRAVGLTTNKLNSGDKMANRHGNKGVAPNYTKNSEMPQLYNGEALDIVYNPHGVVSRMNIGQTLEANLGLACKVLRIKCKTSSLGGITTDEIRLLLSYAYDVTNSVNLEGVLSEYKGIPEGLHQHVRDNIDLIRYWKGCFSKEGTAVLYNPKTGRKYNSPVLIGFNYISKLEQDSDTKMNARGYYLNSNYKSSESPTKGAANGGGQTLGNMEFAALLAYGAKDLLNEMTNERGDNPIARVNFTANKIHEGKGMHVSTAMSMRRSTLKFIMYMEALGARVDIPGIGNIYDVKEDEMCYPTGETLANATDAEIKRGPKITEDQIDGKISNVLADLGLMDLNNYKL